MLLSMTGFGKGEAVSADGSIFQIEISSVNRKQLELRFSMPQEFNGYEHILRKKAAGAISRGAVQIKVIFKPSASAVSVSVNTALLDSIISCCRDARERNNIAGEVKVESLLTLPGMLTADAECDKEGRGKVLEEAFDNALANYQSMRLAEGEALTDDLLARIDALEKMHGELAQLVAGQHEAAKNRLLAKFEAEKLPITVDDSVLLREILFYTDKGDVTEELTRLTSHFSQFKAFLNSSRPAGRSLDFLAQEMFREITTLGNKAFMPGVSPVVVAFKSEMEKIREQIQNIE